MTFDNSFDAECRVFWADALATVLGPNPPTSATWTGLTSILEALRPFMALQRNHAHLPTGGGMDFNGIALSAEKGCLDFDIGDRIVYTAKPATLTIEHLHSSPTNSFLLLQLARHPSSPAMESKSKGRDFLLELAPGELVDRDVWERGYIEIDGDGREVPIPLGARQVTRFLGGKVLIVSKRSLWNSIAATYDGRHDGMTASEIREGIMGALGLG